MNVEPHAKLRFSLATMAAGVLITRPRLAGLVIPVRAVIRIPTALPMPILRRIATNGIVPALQRAVLVLAVIFARSRKRLAALHTMNGVGRKFLSCTSLHSLAYLWGYCFPVPRQGGTRTKNTTASVGTGTLVERRPFLKRRSAYFASYHNKTRSIVAGTGTP